MHTVIGPIQARIRTRRAFAIGTAYVLLSAGLSAQQPSAPRFPPPPIWGPETAVDFPQQYVFRTAAGDALIVRLPSDSEYVKKGGPAEIRYDLHNQVLPEVSVQMAGVGTSYEFVYTVANRQGAHDLIRVWSLIIPPAAGQVRIGTSDPQMVIGSPDDWGGGASVVVVMRQVELPDQPLGRSVTWTQDESTRFIHPGSSVAGFRITSSCKPGFTSALFGSGTWVNIDQELPQAVFDQLKFYDDPTWGKIPDLTFGPMFCGEASPDIITANFVSGVKRLQTLHKVDAGSAFVEDVLDALHSRKELIPNPPKGAVETELFDALKLSLGFRLSRGQ